MLTPEQEAAIEEARRGTSSFIMDAVPGSGKTFTLVKIAHALPLVPVLSVQFNKRTAEESAKKMPSHVKAQTLNSTGHRAWASYTGRRLVLETNKTYGLVSAECNQLKGKEKDRAFEVFGSIMRLVSIAKHSGYVPKSFSSITSSLHPDASWDDMSVDLMDDLDEVHFEIAERVLNASIKLSFDGTVDFDDQLYMSTMFGKSFPKYPIILGDEIQDWSPLNQEMIRLMKPERFIGAGDPYQSIYAFRGADRGAMAKLAKLFNCKKMPLSISFRCPIEGVKRAQLRVPSMRWAEGAINGTVVELKTWKASDIPDEAVFLCRNNAPLFKVAMGFIKAGRGVTLVGRDIGPGLIKILKKFGNPDSTRDKVLVEIDAWLSEKLATAKSGRQGSITDRAECLKVFAMAGDTLGEAIAYAEHLFSSTGTIRLMTGHKAKGLEFDHVVHLDSWMIPSKYAERALSAGDEGPMDQELNLKYVIDTRWKQTLTLVDSEKMDG